MPRDRKNRNVGMHGRRKSIDADEPAHRTVVLGREKGKTQRKLKYDIYLACY